MTMTGGSADLAVQWIEAWVRMDLEWLRRRLAPDFVHVSPFGRLEGREHYLATVEPMARKSVMDLTVRDVIASENRAAVWFRTGHRTVRWNRAIGFGSRMASSRRSGRSTTAP